MENQANSPSLIHPRGSWNNIHSHDTKILVGGWINHYYLGKPPARSNKELQRLFTQLPPQQMLLLWCLHSFPLWRMVLFLPPTQQSSLTFCKHLSHVLPQGHPHHGLLWMVQLHPGAGFGEQGDQESLEHDDFSTPFGGNSGSAHRAESWLGFSTFWWGNCQSLWQEALQPHRCPPLSGTQGTNSTKIQSLDSFTL